VLVALLLVIGVGMVPSECYEWLVCGCGWCFECGSLMMAVMVLLFSTLVLMCWGVGNWLLGG